MRVPRRPSTQLSVFARPVDRYAGKLSGPLRDRIDLTVDVAALPPEDLTSTGEGESSAAIRARVGEARARQRHRAGESSAALNARLLPRELRRVCTLDSRGQRLLRQASEKLGLTARAFDRILRVSRTIADLEGADRVESHHIAEALQFRGV